MSLQINNNTNNTGQLIKPPFPPTIEPKDLVKKSRDGVYTRTPNAFIIYRKLFIETARSEGHFLPMTVISAMSSQSWEQEPEMVKNEYKRIAKATFNYRKELIPKTKQRRKREKWNIVSFEKDPFMKKNSMNCNNCNNELSQYEQTPIAIDSSELIQEKTPSPEISIENTFSDVNMENLFPNFYTSPELSTNDFGSPEQQFEFDLNISPDKFFESPIQSGAQNYQQVNDLEFKEFEAIRQQQQQQQQQLIDINDFGIPEFITTGFNNMDHFSSDISYELFNEYHNDLNIPLAFSETGFVL